MDGTLRAGPADTTPEHRRGTPDVRIGVSGWRYANWRGVFFPPRWPQRRELAYTAAMLNSVEINGSFYSLQHPDSYLAWYEQTPDDFVFAVKGGRFITHMKRLAHVEKPLANFFASGVLRLGGKLGPILWQLPERLPFDADRLAAFFRLLPRDTEAAARLARRHDARVSGRAWSRTDARRPLRHALEVRHESFRDARAVELLREHGIALVVADTAGRWPCLEDVTADFVYVRLHGDTELYVSGYGDDALDRWAERVRAWARGDVPAESACIGPPPPAHGPRDVYVYFDNDVRVRAPFDAMALAHRLGLRPPPPPAPDVPVPSVEVRLAAGPSRWPGLARRRPPHSRGSCK